MVRVSPATTPGHGPHRHPHLCVVHQSRTGSTWELCESAVSGATGATDVVETRVRRAFDASPEDVLWADAVLLATPAHFGYMAGALKDFFERVYYRCLASTVGLPYALVVKGDTDVDGAVSSVQRIATGLRWRLVLPPVTVVGATTPADLARAGELGATLALGLETGIF